MFRNLVRGLNGVRNCSNQQIPFNMEGMRVSQNLIDRSRDQSHERLEPHSRQDSSVYDLDGNTNLENIVQNYVPEPYVAASDSVGLKEGLPNGLSDAPMDRSSQMWTMNERLDSSSGE